MKPIAVFRQVTSEPSNRRAMINTTTQILCTLAVAALFGETAAQLNGYINPLWMSDRRGSARTLGARDFLFSTGGLQQYRTADDPRTATNLVYLDDQGRYRPVYRQDRIFRADQNYYRVNEPINDQYLPIQTNTAPIIPAAV